MELVYFINGCCNSPRMKESMDLQMGNVTTDTTSIPEKKIDSIVFSDQSNLPQQVQNTSKSILRHWPTFAATFSTALASCSLGMVIGYSSPAVPDINDNPNPFHLSSTDVSILTSIIAVGGVAGEIAGGYMSDRVGRRETLMYNSVFTVVGWVMVGCAPNVACMQVGRVLTGFACGVADISVPVYISEISEKSVRGFMCSCHELFINIGLLLVFALGIFLHWNWLAIACAAVPAAMVILLVFVPESPRWLASNRSKEETMAALHWLRSDKIIEDLEYQDILNNIKENGSDMKWKEMGQPVLYKPVAIIVALLFFQQMAGYGVLPEYMVSIFQSAGSDWSPYEQTAIVGAVGVVANTISGLVVDKAGRRPMLMLSSAVMTVSIGGLASFFTIQHYTTRDDLVSQLWWLPIVSLILYNFGVALGYGPIPFYLCSEMLPLRARSKAGSVSIASVWVFIFLTTFSFNWLLDALNGFGVYWMLCGFSFLGFIFAFFVPEMKGRSLEEIEKHFSGE